VRGDLQHQVGEGAGLGFGEVELEGDHGGSILLIKYVINSSSVVLVLMSALRLVHWFRLLRLISDIGLYFWRGQGVASASPAG
jgi:hypothetical protein